MLNSSFLNLGLTRRDALKFASGTALGVAGLGLSACGASQEPTPPAGDTTTTLDLSNPADSLRAFIKLTGDLDPAKETFGWFGGRIFSVMTDAPLKPLVDVEGFGVLRVSPQSGDTYRLFNRELAFYKDPMSGEFIDEWTNPINGATCEVSPIHNAVVNAEVAPILKQDFDGTIVEIPFNPPWTVMRDRVFSTFELHTAFPNPMDPKVWPRESSGPITRISEVFQRIASKEQLANPDLTSADYGGTWTRVGPWLPWMLMGQTDGHILYRTFMDKTGPVSNLPRPLLELTEQRYPEFLQSPGDDTWGQPNDSSFTVYMAEREPVPQAE